MTVSIHPISDIHLEFGDYPFEFPKADYLVLGGDIHSGHTDSGTIQKFYNQIACAGFNGIVSTIGNHELWGKSLFDIVETLDNFDLVNVTEDDENSIAFVSLTLFPHRIPDIYMTNDRNQIAGWNDYNLSRIHEREMEQLKEALDKVLDNYGKIVVVSHYAPSLVVRHPDFNKPQFWGSEGAFYVSVDDIIEEYEPDVWIFGHTHRSYYGKHYNRKTLLVSNPLGYQTFNGIENREFNPNLILRV